MEIERENVKRVTSNEVHHFNSSVKIVVHLAILSILTWGPC